jgi:benzoate/toluate 1,2-dioxygenase beta subunit
VTATVSPEEVQSCAELLYREARHLDRVELAAWLELFTDDALYWVPLREDYRDPDTELNIIYDDRQRLAGRIGRLQSGVAYAQDPPSRTARVLGNLQVERRPDGYATETAFILYELRAGETQLLAGRYFHELLTTPGGLQIRRKVVELVNRTEPLFNITFIL